MTTFKVGERVSHIGMGDGVVTSTDNDEVCVTYSRRAHGGKTITGRYDRRWFEMHPGYLFHRRADCNKDRG